MNFRKQMTKNLPRYRRPRIIRGFDAPEQIRKMRWYFHEYDKDDRPSVPHAHSYEGKFKLNPWDGTVYEIINHKLILCGKAKDKELASLLDNPAFIAFALKEIQWYQQQFPYKSPKAPSQYWMRDIHGKSIADSNSFSPFEITIEFIPLKAKRYYRRYIKWIPKR